MWRLRNFCDSQHKTPFSNSLQSHSYIAIGRDMLISDLAENCSVEMMALASLSQGLSRDKYYLYQGCNMQILHFNIKPHNILLC